MDAFEQHVWCCWHLRQQHATTINNTHHPRCSKASKTLATFALIIDLKGEYFNEDPPLRWWDQNMSIPKERLDKKKLLKLHFCCSCLAYAPRSYNLLVRKATITSNSSSACFWPALPCVTGYIKALHGMLGMGVIREPTLKNITDTIPTTTLPDYLPTLLLWGYRKTSK